MTDHFNMFKDFIFKDKRLNQFQKSVLLVMKNASNGQTKTAYMSMATLGDIMTCRREKANKAVSLLKKLGYLIQVGPALGNRPLHYSVHLKTQEQIDAELSTGVATSTHLNAELSTDGVIHRCVDDNTPGVSMTTHYCVDDNTPGVSMTTHEFNRIEFNKNECKAKAFLNDLQIPPPPQSQNLKSGLVREKGDPSFSAQKQHRARATALGVGEKRADESWSAFILRINGAIAPPRGQHYESGVAMI